MVFKVAKIEPVLVFKIRFVKIAVTSDEMFRAYNEKTGKLLVETKFPAGVYACTSIYSLKKKNRL